MIDYPFADDDRLEDRNTYFYTPYEGRAFLDSWRDQRSNVRMQLPDPIAPRPTLLETTPEIGPVKTQELLEYLSLAISRGDIELPAVRCWLCKLVKKFEVTKRIHSAYDAQFRAVDRNAYHDLTLYIRLADVFEAAYDETKDLIFLNVLLKCIDTLCSVKDGLLENEQARLAWLIAQERAHVDALTKNVLQR